MTLLQHKVCLIGAFAVGKTSLVRRFVHARFEDKYQTTLGVKVDRKEVPIGEDTVRLLLWDMAGEDAFEHVRSSHLRGASGYVIVADLTRAETLDEAVAIHERCRDEVGGVPFVCALNKSDLRERRELADDTVARLKDEGWVFLETSALDGSGVDDMFAEIARRVVGG